MMLSTNHDLSGLPDPESDHQFYSGVPFKRLLAWFVDFIVIMLITSLLVVASLGLGALAFPILGFVVNIAYRIFTLSRRSATLGMIVTGIEIRNAKGNKLNLEEASWHSFLYTGISLVFIALIVSMIMMLLNKRGQGLHDYFLGTTAINKPI